MLLLPIASAWACPPFDDAIERLSTAILNGVDHAVPRQDIAQSLSCAEAPATSIARYYLAEGAAGFYA